MLRAQVNHRTQNIMSDLASLPLDLKMKDDYGAGLVCPYEMGDGWIYRGEDGWYEDPTLEFECTKINQPKQ